uniref:Uncharacterized protein n=1 Tax=Arundo donax TaxID=35708 RepID=A0A0A9B740_ARUDO
MVHSKIDGTVQLFPFVALNTDCYCAIILCTFLNNYYHLDHLVLLMFIAILPRI